MKEGPNSHHANNKVAEDSNARTLTTTPTNARTLTTTPTSVFASSLATAAIGT